MIENKGIDTAKLQRALNAWVELGSLPINSINGSTIVQAVKSLLPSKIDIRWHVESWTAKDGCLVDPFVEEPMARAVATELMRQGRMCVRVTGPHEHEVPC